VSQQVWTVKAALDWCLGYLTEKGDEHPRRSAEWLLSAATGLSRVELYAYHDRPLGPEERNTLRRDVKRRAAGEPLQYVTGEVAFRHLVVKVCPGVLIPRPETEVLVGEALVELAHREAPVVADPCTGSGVVALSIAQEHAGARVWATDLSSVAVEVATQNARRLGLDGVVSLLIQSCAEGSTLSSATRPTSRPPTCRRCRRRSEGSSLSSRSMAGTTVLTSSGASQPLRSIGCLPTAYSPSNWMNLGCR